MPRHHFYAGILLAISTLCSCANAEIPCITFSISANDSIANRVETGGFGARDGSLLYDNASFPEQGGRTNFVDFPRFGGQEIGDDLILTSSGSGFVVDGTFAIRNLSTTGTLSRFTVVHRWYSEAGDQLAERTLTANLGGGGLPPLWAAQLNSTGGVYRPYNIPLNGTIRWSLQFTFVQGISIDDLAFVVAGPHTLGSSSSLIHNYTTGQDIDLGNSGNSNLMFRVYGTVPSPASTGLGLLSTIFALRRRR